MADHALRWLSPILREHILHFNGGLFESVEALPLDRSQFDVLCLAAIAEWKDVEPAIFGTLLERALNERERHALGAHYTPRAYVERLVIPTIVEPLRGDWANVQAAALTLQRAGKTADAIDVLLEFRRRLCTLEVLDPACGSGNFLYVTLEHLKRLEAEVNDALEGLGHAQQSLRETGLTVDPHQLKGIELNPRAAAITDLVLWIGFLQWHFRTWGASALPPEPIIKRFHNIEHRDALLAYDSVEPAVDERGNAHRDNWWIHGEPRANFRPALSGLRRYIATPETAKHRFFVFLDASILPDNMLVNVASLPKPTVGPPIFRSRIFSSGSLELNATRAAEERSGLVRWLRPEFQNVTATQAALGVEMEEHEFQPAAAARLPWPPSLPERVRVVRDFLLQTPAPVAAGTVARNFIRARSPEVSAILEALVALGQAKKVESAYWV